MAHHSRRETLPTPLLQSDEWIHSNELEQKNFCGRLDYIQEIHKNCTEWLQSQEGFENQADFLDIVEQDLFINLAPYKKNCTIGPWLVHTSWTFGTTPEGMLTALPQAVIDGLSATDIGFECNEHRVLSVAGKAYREFAAAAERVLRLGHFYQSHFTPHRNRYLSVCTALGRQQATDEQKFF